MANITLRPNDATTYSQWTPSGDTPNYKCVDEVSSDGDTTYVFSNAAYDSDRYGIENTPEIITVDTVINSISVHVVAKGTGNIDCWVKESSGQNSIGYETLTSSYVDYEFTYYEPLYDDPPFSKAYIDSLKVGVESTSDTNDKYVTQVYVIVNYTEAGTDTNSDRDAKITGAPEDIYTREAITPLPGDDTDLAISYSEQNMTDVSASDDDRVGLETTSAKYLIHQFKKYNSNNALENMNVSWEGQTTLAPSSSTVYLQVYNLDTTLWETLDSVNSSSINTDFSLSGIVNANLADYYDANYMVSFRVYQEVI